MYFSDVLCGVINDGNLKAPRTTEKINTTACCQLKIYGVYAAQHHYKCA